MDTTSAKDSDASMSQEAQPAVPARKSPRKRLLIAATTLLVLIGGVLVAHGALKRSLTSRLVGDWHGEGELPAMIVFHFGDAPKGTQKSLHNATVELVFLPDGTYHWSQRNQGPDGHNAMQIPTGNNAPPPYEVVHVDYFAGTLQLRIGPMGHCALRFHDRDSFTMEGPQGKLEFRRKK